MQIAALLFDKITVLDIVGPIEVLSWLPGSDIAYVGKEKGPVRGAPSGLGLIVDHNLDELTGAEIVLVPGGPGTRLLLEDEAILGWLRQAHDASQWTASICTGSLLLGAAGLLDGLTATTHWNAAGMLDGFGATYVEERVVPQGRIVTSAGVSSGIDMALYLVAEIAGDEAAKAVQLAIEYDPTPPFDSGAPSKATPEVLERSRGIVMAAVERALA